MGRGIHYECEKCNEKYDFYYGIGMLYFFSQKELETKVKSGEYGEKLKQKFQENPFSHISAERDLYFCPNCHVPMNDFNLSVVKGNGLFSDGNIIFRYVHECPKCKIEMISYTESDIENETEKCPEDLRCPKCDGKLKENDWYFWD